MLESTARPLVQEPPLSHPQQETLQPQPQTRVHISGFERTLIFACGVLAMATCIACLFMQNRLTNIQRQYQDVQATISKQSQSVSTLKQEIGELSNSERLDAFAKAHGFQVIDGNIKRVSAK